MYYDTINLELVMYGFPIALIKAEDDVWKLYRTHQREKQIIAEYLRNRLK